MAATILPADCPVNLLSGEMSATATATATRLTQLMSSPVQRQLQAEVERALQVLSTRYRMNSDQYYRAFLVQRHGTDQYVKNLTRAYHLMLQLQYQDRSDEYFLDERVQRWAQELSTRVEIALDLKKR